MNPTPAGWPRITSALHYRDPGAMIDWLCQAFGFAVRVRVADDDGKVQHSELSFGDGGLIMVGPERAASDRRFATDLVSPLTAGGCTQELMLYVDDVEAHCAQARAAGARIVHGPEVHDYGAEHWADRSYAALDPEGHLWWISQRVRG